MTSLVMSKGIFSKSTAHVGVLPGILAIVSVVGPFLGGSLGLAVIPASALATVWVLLAGHGLYRLGQH